MLSASLRERCLMPPIDRKDLKVGEWIVVVVEGERYVHLGVVSEPFSGYQINYILKVYSGSEGVYDIDQELITTSEEVVYRWESAPEKYRTRLLVGSILE